MTDKTCYLIQSSVRIPPLRGRSRGRFETTGLNRRYQGLLRTRVDGATAGDCTGTGLLTKACNAVTPFSGDKTPRRFSSIHLHIFGTFFRLSR
jgi:hypothetical protein